MSLGSKIVKLRIPILILVLLLLIPSIIGIAKTRVNYDMLTYLPNEIDTVVGQDKLMEQFNKGAFTFVVVENMQEQDVAKLKEQFKGVNHVETILWYDSIFDINIPKELLPNDILKSFQNKDATLMAVFFDTSTSDDETMKAIEEMRCIANKQCFISGMSALVVDLKNLCESEEPIYVGIAVILSCIVMMLLLDNWLVPFIFLTSIGMMILMNLGSNYFLGEVSYITKALSAVLQLAVTMDYSIFLWHSYEEQCLQISDKKEAMSIAISKTFASVLGSSITTIAGFAALCFMSFALGMDLGIVMAKGVILGVIGCVTVLPSLILVFDKLLTKANHKSLIKDASRLSKHLLKASPIVILIFVIMIAPSYYGYQKTNDEVYYDLAESLPKDIDYVIANSKLSKDFDIASTHMVLVDAKLSSKNMHQMIDEMEKVDGVKYVLGLESIIGRRIPAEILPNSLKSLLESDESKLLLINSSYKVSSDLVNKQIEQLNTILKKYDHNGMLIGEAPCMKDILEITDNDFKIVNMISIIAIFIIIAIVEKSAILPIILIIVIEAGIFLNLGITHYLNQSLCFITPICISTIQLGATVDYAILLTTRYKRERMNNQGKQGSIKIALSTSIPSIIVSGMGLFAATFGVALYSDIEIISSMCMLMARGAIISMILVIFVLPALLYVFDYLICMSTVGLRAKKE